MDIFKDSWHLTLIHHFQILNYNSNSTQSIFECYYENSLGFLTDIKINVARIDSDVL